MPVQFVRRLREDEIALVDRFANELKPSFVGGKYKNVISWCNIYMHQQFNFDNPTREVFHKWISEFVREMYPDQQMHLLKYDLLMNPAGSKTNQVWHTDYEGKIHTLLIPLVAQGTETATQFIEQNINMKAQVSSLGYESHYPNNIMDILQQQNRDFVKVSQIVCKSHCAMLIKGKVVHRGIANPSSNERMLLTATISREKIRLHDEPVICSNMEQDQ